MPERGNEEKRGLVRGGGGGEESDEIHGTSTFVFKEWRRKRYMYYKNYNGDSIWESWSEQRCKGVNRVSGKWGKNAESYQVRS